jgi:hypothetical protein
MTFTVGNDPAPRVWVWCDSEQAPSSARVRSDGSAECLDCGATDHDQANADGTFAKDEPERSRPERCPVCGGLNPGDITHTRC